GRGEHLPRADGHQLTALVLASTPTHTQPPPALLHTHTHTHTHTRTQPHRPSCKVTACIPSLCIVTVTLSDPPQCPTFGPLLSSSPTFGPLPSSHHPHPSDPSPPLTIPLAIIPATTQ